MKTITKLFLNFLLIFSIINCSTNDYHEIKEENKFQHINLKESETQIVFINKDESKEKMYVELIFSHPSKYFVTFNQYDGEIDENSNLNLFYLDNEEIFISPLRKLSSNYTENQTDLIEKEEKYFGRNMITLKLGQDIKNIILSVFREEEMQGESDEKIIVRYKYNEKDEYNLQSTKIINEIEKDILNITFTGISTKNENESVKNISVEYIIDVFDKNILQLKYENIYFYAFNEEKGLFSKHLKIKGDIIKKTNYLKIRAPLNDKKEQLLLIRAKVKNININEEYLLQYEVIEFKVEEESGERKWSEDDNNNNKDEAIDNKNKLIIIIISFGSIIFLTFIVVFIYFALNKKRDLDLDPIIDGDDYKNIGQIKTINEDEGQID